MTNSDDIVVDHAIYNCLLSAKRNC